MAHRFRTFIFFAAALPSIAMAQTEPPKLKGDEIQRLLGNHVLANKEKQTIQAFSSNGRTFYKSKEKEIEGAWKVVEDLYCSTWPPETEFSCYYVSVSGKTVSFIAKDGSSNQWTLVK